MHICTYANDTHVYYGFYRPSKVRALQDGVSACVDDVAVWMKSNRLHLNATKTEILWCAHPRPLYKLYQTSHFALAATLCNQYNKYKTSASSSTEDSPWLSSVHVSKTVAAALLLFSRHTASNGLSAGRCYYLLSRHSCCRAWIMEVQLLQAFPSTYTGPSTVHPQCSNTSHLPSPQVRPRVSIASGTAVGFLFLNESNNQIPVGRTGVSLPV